MFNFFYVDFLIINKYAMHLFKHGLISTADCIISLLSDANCHLHMLQFLRLEDDANRNHQEFQKWPNGGGMFHKTACIESTALIEIGAVVHSECVIASNVHIGSGTIVGPAVKIGESTKVGYASLFIQQ